MNKKIFLSIFFVPVVIYFSHDNLHAQYRIDAWTISGGGGTVSGSSHTITGVLGETLTGLAENDSHLIHLGFLSTVVSSPVTRVEQTDDLIPLKFNLEQNYPNPFNPSTTIRFSIPQSEHVTLLVYDLLGRPIATLVDEQLEPGEYSAVFDAEGIASGMYIYRIRAGADVFSRRMILLR
jgi:hypothetical protein